MTAQLAKQKKERPANGRSRPARPVDIIINGNVRIPSWVIDLDSFCRWTKSDEFPDRGKFSWLGDKLSVEVYSDLLRHLSDAEIENMRTKAFAPIRSGLADISCAGDVWIDELVHIPRWVCDTESFHGWAISDQFPAHGRFAFLADKLWVDLCMETNLHNQIKTVITIVLGSIVMNEALGFFYADKMLLAHPKTGLSQEPDAMFVSSSHLEKGLAVLEEGDQSTRVSGSVDMTLEVVSKSSVDKDMVDLVTLYAKAGVAEYWLVDSTIETPELVINRLVGGKYVAARKRDGWVKSKVFGRSFRLTCKKDAKGVSHFNLETK